MNNAINQQNFLQVIANYVVSIIAQRKASIENSASVLRPVIMIDGPAGTGKSTFTKNLFTTLKEMDIEVCLFEQDRFGVFRDIRANNKINPCSDLARDPKTVTKLKEVMEGKTAILPIYDPSTGQRLKERTNDPRSHLSTGDVILYEGVSSLSAVIYDNANFSELYQQAVPIRIFFRPDSSETLYASRLKRDSEERNVDKLSFDDSWDDSERNNWLYTMRGIFNANIIVTRSVNNVFNYDIVDTIKYLDFTICPVSNDIHLQNSEKLMNERRKKIKEQVFNWFENYHQSLYGAFAFEKYTKDHYLNMKVKQRDELSCYFMQSFSANGRYQSRREKPYAADDNEVLLVNTLTRFHAAFYRQVNSLPMYSVDDLYIHKMHNNLDAQSLAHDKAFNSKIKIAVENALAAIVLDNLDITSDPVLRVTKAIQSYIHPLFERYMIDKTTDQERVIVEFLAAPFDPSLGAYDLGRIMKFENGASYSKKDILNFLNNKLDEVNKDNFFTHMRLHIRFMDLLCEPKNNLDLSNVFDEQLVTTYQKMFARYRTDYVFHSGFGNDNERRGRHMLRSKQTTTSFGTYVDIHDLPQAFRQLIGKRSLPVHLAGKSYIRSTPSTFFNKKSIKEDLPSLCSGSGAIALLLCARTLVDFNKDELLKYHLTALANTIGGGHHTLNECMAVSQLVLELTTNTINDLIPESLMDKKPFQQFMKLIDENKTQIGKLWHQYTPTASNGEKLLETKMTCHLLSKRAA